VKARAIAEEVKSLLAPACHRIDIVGDIRRQKPQVGHIELLVIPKPEISDGEPIPPQYRDLIDFLSDPMPDASLESLPADTLESAM